LYKYRLPNPKKKKPKTQLAEPAHLTLNRTKSTSVEINEKLLNKDNSLMALSRFFEAKEELDLDKEEAKLVRKETMTK
jgi:hypothetical protein